LICDRPYKKTGGHESDFTAHGYDAFGVFGTALKEKIGVFHPRALKTAPKTPTASQARPASASQMRADSRPRIGFSEATADRLTAQPVGLGRIVAFHYCSSTSHQTR
jgi:hypothetical protein